MASSNIAFKGALDSFLDRRNEASDREVKYAQAIQHARIQNETLAMQQSQERRGIVQQDQNMRLNEINMRNAIDGNSRLTANQNYTDAQRQAGWGNYLNQTNLDGKIIDSQQANARANAERFGISVGQGLLNAKYSAADQNKDVKRLKELTGYDHGLDMYGRAYMIIPDGKGGFNNVYRNTNKTEKDTIDQRALSGEMLNSAMRYFQSNNNAGSNEGVPSSSGNQATTDSDGTPFYLKKPLDVVDLYSQPNVTPVNTDPTPVNKQFGTPDETGCQPGMSYTECGDADRKLRAQQKARKLSEELKGKPEPSFVDFLKENISTNLAPKIFGENKNRLPIFRD